MSNLKVVLGLKKKKKKSSEGKYLTALRRKVKVSVIDLRVIV